MPSLLVWAAAIAPHPHPEHQWLRNAPGDVIDINADADADWGSEVRRLALWRVLRVDCAVHELLQLVECDPIPALTYRGLRRLRVRRLDLAQLPGDDVTLATLLAAMLTVPPVPNYHVFG